MRLLVFNITQNMKQFSILLFTFFCLSTLAQTPTELFERAQELAQEDKLQESLQAFEEAFKSEEIQAHQYFNAACIAAKADDDEKTFQWLDQAANKGWKNLDFSKIKEELRPLHKKPEWDSFITKVEANLAYYEKDFDKPLKEKLEAIYYQDQVLRQLYADAEKKFGRESRYMKEFWALMGREDQRLLQEVLAIIDEHGWVGQSKVGGQANAAIFMVIQHADLSTQESYLPMMKASVIEGESSAKNLAMLTDRVQVRQGKPQTYGTQFKRNESNERVLYDIIDPENLNKRRAEIGLPPIEGKFNP